MSSVSISSGRATSFGEIPDLYWRIKQGGTRKLELKHTHSIIPFASATFPPAWRSPLSTHMCQRTFFGVSPAVRRSRRFLGFVLIICNHLRRVESGGRGVGFLTYSRDPSPPSTEILILKTFRQWVWKSPRNAACIESRMVNSIGFQ